MKKKKKLWSSSGNLAQKTAASIKSVIGKEISSHDVCRILKEEQASVFLGICFAPKMPLFKAQSGKSATPFKIAFYNDWEKRQRPKSKMIALPLMSTTPEWRFSSYFQMPFKLDRGKRPSIPASYPICGKKMHSILLRNYLFQLSRSKYLLDGAALYFQFTLMGTYFDPIYLGFKTTSIK